MLRAVKLRKGEIRTKVDEGRGERCCARKAAKGAAAKGATRFPSETPDPAPAPGRVAAKGATRFPGETLDPAPAPGRM